MVFSKILDTHLLVRWFCQLYRYTVFIGHISTMFDYGRVVIMTSHRFSWFIGHCSHMDGVVACIRLLLFCVFDVWICKIAIHRSYFLWTNSLYNPAINLPFGDGKHTTQQNGDFGHCLWHWVGPRTSPHVHPLNPIWLTILSGIFYHLRYGVFAPIIKPTLARTDASPLLRRVCHWPSVQHPTWWSVEKTFRGPKDGSWAVLRVLWIDGF